MTNTLPTPGPDALTHSQRLVERIKSLMETRTLSFSDFMQACLYEPGLGYYVAGSHKFGETGDFITAPMVTPLFAFTLAQASYPTIQKVQGAYLELGAGNGQLAFDILTWLEAHQDVNTQYYILEVSPDCRALQEEKLKRFEGRVKWLETLPKNFRGVILGNEVLDALPVHVFHYAKQKLYERRVGLKGDKFIWVDEACDNPLLEKSVEALNIPEASREHYISEINPTLPMFVRSLIDCLAAGEIIFLDYGFLQDTYYHPDRHMGTLMCHYRHQAHADPFLYPGLQDITAHVNFSAVGNTGQNAGLQVALYTQAEFLLENGLLEHMQEALNMMPAEKQTVQSIELSREIQKLVQPHEMGELFKVMVMVKG